MDIASFLLSMILSIARMASAGLIRETNCIIFIGSVCICWSFISSSNNSCKSALDSFRLSYDKYCTWVKLFNSSEKVMKVFIALAFIVNTLFTAPDTFPTTTGTSSLIIPAFSLAILVSVWPRYCIWSKPILVITHRSGVMILVQSRRPPMPTSITATSTFWSAK